MRNCQKRCTDRSPGPCLVVVLPDHSSVTSRSRLTVIRLAVMLCVKLVLSRRNAEAFSPSRAQTAVRKTVRLGPIAPPIRRLLSPFVVERNHSDRCIHLSCCPHARASWQTARSASPGVSPAPGKVLMGGSSMNSCVPRRVHHQASTRKPEDLITRRAPMRRRCAAPACGRCPKFLAPRSARFRCRRGVAAPDRR